VQRDCHERLRRAGAEVATVYGLDEALEQLESWGLLRTARPRGCEGNATQQCISIGNM
jgi:hypothetical protein